MNKALSAVGLAACLALWSCQQESAPATSPAEVPQPGPAAMVDPGPAPAGQWEPDDEGSTTEADPAVESTPPATPPEESDDTTSEGPADDDGSVSLLLQDWDETQNLIAAHQGKVVVVDFWSTSCLPCRREFPHLVALQKSHPEDVVCVSVSLDYSGRKSRPPESYRESVLEFLNEQQAAFENVLSTDDPDELQQRLDLAPIPLVWVYDRRGERRRAFDNADLGGKEFTYPEDVVPFVETLLAESPETSDNSADSADTSLR